MSANKILARYHSLLQQSTTSVYQQCACAISTSAILYHNPALKKKGKVVVDQKKIQRQKERQEAKLRKQAVSLPIDPDSIPDPSWFHDSRMRQIPKLSEAEIESRILLQKEWAREQMNNHKNDLKILRDRLKSRQDALRELKKESSFLFEECLKLDKTVYPLKITGPMNTPPINGYIAPDYVDEKK